MMNHTAEPSADAVVTYSGRRVTVLQVEQMVDALDAILRAAQQNKPHAIDYVRGLASQALVNAGYTPVPGAKEIR